MHICKAKKLLKLHCNAGFVKVTETLWFNEMEVWHPPKGVFNSLSLKTLKMRQQTTNGIIDNKMRQKTSKGIIDKKMRQKTTKGIID